MCRSRRYAFLGALAAVALTCAASASVAFRHYFAEPIAWCFAKLGRLCFGSMTPIDGMRDALDGVPVNLFGANGKLKLYERRRLDRLHWADPLAT